jgi:hypothetical protein
VAERAPFAVYVYGLVEAADAAALPHGPGAIDERFPLELVEEGELVALASEIELEDFEQRVRAAERGSLSSIERLLRAHEDVLARGGGAEALLPFRFGTVVAGREEVRVLLRERAAEFRAQLEQLRGAREWGVKGLVARESLESALVAEEPMLAELRSDAEAGTGAAFFARKRLEQQLEERLRDAAGGLAEFAHARLASVAREAVLNPPQPRELSGYDEEMILNAAYLVDRAREDDLRGVVEELEAELREHGLHFELTGPWPAFNFVERAPEAVA